MNEATKEALRKARLEVAGALSEQSDTVLRVTELALVVLEAHEAQPLREEVARLKEQLAENAGEARSVTETDPQSYLLGGSVEVGASDAAKVAPWLPKPGDRVRTAKTLDRSQDLRNTWAQNRRPDALGWLRRVTDRTYVVVHDDDVDAPYRLDELSPAPDDEPDSVDPSELAKELPVRGDSYQCLVEAERNFLRAHGWTQLLPGIPEIWRSQDDDVPHYRSAAITMTRARYEQR